MRGTEVIINRIQNALQHAKAQGLNGITMLSLVISVFLPFYITLACMFAAVIVALLQKKVRGAVFCNSSNLFIMGVIQYSVTVSAVYQNVTGILYSLVFLIALIVMFYGKAIMTRRLFEMMLDTACFTSVICVPVAVVQMFWFSWITVDGRPPSTFTNANYYGMMIEFVVMITMYRIFTNGNLKMRKWYIGVILVNLIGLYLSASMSSCMTVFLTMLIYLTAKGKKKSAMTVLFLFIAVTAMILLSGQIFPRVDTATDIFRGRIDIWSTSLKGIADHALFGMGPGAYRMVWPMYGGFATFHAHNLFLDTLLNFGVIGGCAIFFYTLLQLKKLMQRFWVHAYQNDNILVLVMFAAVLIHGCTDATIFWVQTGMLFLLVYTATGIKNHASEPPQSKESVALHRTETWIAKQEKPTLKRETKRRD